MSDWEKKYIYIYYDKTNDGILMGMTMGRFRLWFISNWGFMGDVTTDGNSLLEDKLECIRLVWIICLSNLGYPILSYAYVETGNVQWKMGNIEFMME